MLETSLTSPPPLSSLRSSCDQLPDLFCTVLFLSADLSLNRQSALGQALALWDLTLDNWGFL